MQALYQSSAIRRIDTFIDFFQLVINWKSTYSSDSYRLNSLLGKLEIT